MGGFESKWLSRPGNLGALADLPGRWIDKVHQWRPPGTVVLDMDSSESPTYGERRDFPLPTPVEKGDHGPAIAGNLANVGLLRQVLRR